MADLVIPALQPASAVANVAAAVIAVRKLRNEDRPRAATRRRQAPITKEGIQFQEGAGFPPFQGYNSQRGPGEGLTAASADRGLHRRGRSRHDPHRVFRSRLAALLAHQMAKIIHGRESVGMVANTVSRTGSQR